MSYPDYAIAHAAQELCRSRGQDPFGRVMIPAEGGQWSQRYGPRWTLAAEEVVRYLELRDAVRNHPDLTR